MERREFLQLGLGAMAAFGTKAIADVTPPSGSQELPSFALEQTADEPDTAGLALTEDNILGPYHRKGAPYRAKITPPLAEGTPMLVRGVVYSHKTKKPIPYPVDVLKI